MFLRLFLAALVSIVVFSNPVLASVGDMSFRFENTGSNVGRGLSNTAYWDVIHDGRQYIAVSDYAISVSRTGKVWRQVYKGGAGQIAFGAGVRLAVGFGYAGFFRSRDGLNWRQVPTPSVAGGNNLIAVAYGGGQFMALDQSLNAYVSTDGVSWTKVGQIPGWLYVSTTYSKLRYINGVFYYPVSGIIYSSADGGRTWVAHNTNANFSLLDIAFNGVRYVAVGAGGTIVQSTDLTLWFTQTVAGVSTDLNAIAWNGSRFIVVGGSRSGWNSPALLESTDGLTWVSKPGINNNLFALALHGNEVLAMGDSVAIKSVNGGAYAVVADVANTANFVAAASHGQVKVLVDGNGTIWSSANGGRTWTQQAVGQHISTVAYGGGRFLAIDAWTPAVFESTDGVAWTNVTPAGFSLWSRNAIAWTGNAFIVATAYGVWKRTLGGVWQQIATTSPGFDSLYWDGSRLIGIQGTSYAISLDQGATWTNLASIPGAGWGPGVLAYNGKTYVVVSGSVLQVSPDMLNWTTPPLPTANSTPSMYAVVWTGREFVVVDGGNDRVLYSADGYRWIEKPIDLPSAYTQYIDEAMVYDPVDQSILLGRGSGDIVIGHRRAQAEATRFSGDFNGDGKADVLYHEASTGRLFLRLMNGLTPVQSAFAPHLTVAWRIADIADFNGDGRSDILFHDPATNRNYVMLMQGNRAIGRGFLPALSSAWEVSGTGDFDGDGKADILFHDPSTGRNFIYFMSGRLVRVKRFAPALPANWDVAGIGDFNRDGRADIMFHDRVYGRNFLMLMNGARAVKKSFIPALPDGWRLAGVADFNGDGMSDILFHQASTGRNFLMTMFGKNVLAKGFCAGLSSRWQISEIGDLDGDGKADIVYRDAQTARSFVMLMNGRLPKRKGFTPSLKANWNIGD